MKCQHCSEEIVPSPDTDQEFTCPHCQQTIASAETDSPLIDFVENNVEEKVEDGIDKAKDKLAELAEESGLADVAHGAAPLAAAAGFGAGLFDENDDDSASNESDSDVDSSKPGTMSLSEALRDPGEAPDEDDELQLSPVVEDNDELVVAESDDDFADLDLNDDDDDDDDFDLSLDDDDDDGIILEALDDAAEVVGDAKAAVAGTVGDVVDAASEALDSAGDMAAGAANAVTGAADAAGDAVSGMVDAASDAASGVTDAASDVITGAADAAAEAGEGIMDKAADLATPLGGAAAAIGGVAAAAGSMLNDAGEAVGDAASDAVESISNTAEGAIDAAGDAVEGVIDSLGDDEDDDIDFLLDDDDEPSADDALPEFAAEQPEESSEDFAAAAPAGDDDTDEDWLSGDLSPDDTHLASDDTQLESSGSMADDLRQAQSSALDFDETDEQLVETETAKSSDDIPAENTAFDMVQGDAKPGSPTAGFMPAAVPARSGMIGNLIKGGLAALLVLLIAQFGCWWGLGYDPIGLGAALPSSMQFLIPSSLVARTPVARIPSGLAVQPITDDADDSGGGDDDSLEDKPDSGGYSFPPKVNGGDEERGDQDAGSTTLNEDGSTTSDDDAAIDQLLGGTPSENASSVSEESLGNDPLEGGTDQQPSDDGGIPGGGLADAGSTTNSGDAGMSADSNLADLPSGEGSGDRTPAGNDVPADLDNLLGSDPPENQNDGSGNMDAVDAVLDDANLDDANLDDANLDDVIATDDDPVAEEKVDVYANKAPLDGATFNPDQVTSSIASARTASEGLEAARSGDRAALKAAAQTFYVAWSRVAETATLIDRADTSVTSESLKALVELQQDKSKHVLLSSATRSWLGKKRASNGVVLTGTVSSVAKAGQINRMTVTMLDKRKTQIAVVTHNPAAIPVGSKLIAMGVRVDNPTLTLPGFQGRDAIVIYVTDQILPLK